MGNANKTRMTTWEKRSFQSSWWFQPIWKISVKMGIFPNLLGNTKPKTVDPPFFFAKQLGVRTILSEIPSLNLFWIIFLWIIRKKNQSRHTHTQNQHLSNRCQPPNFLLVVWNYNRVFKGFWTSTPFFSTGNPQKFVKRSRFRMWKNHIFGC